MQIKLDSIKNKNIIRITGPIKSGMEFDFADAIDSRRDNGNDTYMDFKDVLFVNAAVLGIILNSHRDHEKRNAKLVVFEPHPSVKELFEMTKFDLILNIENMSCDEYLEGLDE